MTVNRESWIKDGVWATIATLAFGGAASLFSIPYVGVDKVWPLFSSTDGSLALSSILAAGGVGGMCWFILTRVGPENVFLNGVIAGVATGIGAHPVMWFLWPFLPPSPTPSYAFLMPFASFWSWLFVGWITVPLAVLGGLVISGLRKAVAVWSSGSDSEQ